MKTTSPDFVEGFHTCKGVIREFLVSLRERLHDEESQKQLDVVMDKIFRMTVDD